MIRAIFDIIDTLNMFGCTSVSLTGCEGNPSALGLAYAAGIQQPGDPLRLDSGRHGVGGEGVVLQPGEQVFAGRVRQVRVRAGPDRHAIRRQVQFERPGQLPRPRGGLNARSGLECCLLETERCARCRSSDAICRQALCRLEVPNSRQSLASEDTVNGDTSNAVDSRVGHGLL
jgi:hypothetical protein